MYERVKKKSYLVKNIKNSRLAAIFSVPIFYHKFYPFSSKSEIYKYSDIAWLAIETPLNNFICVKNTMGGYQTLQDSPTLILYSLNRA